MPRTHCTTMFLRHRDRLLLRLHVALPPEDHLNWTLFEPRLHSPQTRLEKALNRSPLQALQRAASPGALAGFLETSGVARLKHYSYDGDGLTLATGQEGVKQESQGFWRAQQSRRGKADQRADKEEEEIVQQKLVLQWPRSSRQKAGKVTGRSGRTMRSCQCACCNGKIFSPLNNHYHLARLDYLHPSSPV